MGSQGYLSFKDFGGEPAAVSINTGNITAVSLPGTLTQWGAFRDATDAITLGTITDEALYAFKTKLSNEKPADKNAQRERKWLVSYEDNTAFFDVLEAIPNAGYHKIFNLEIPTADASKLPADIDTDQVSLAQPEIADWVEAFEALAKSPYGGDAHVLKIELVGRNL